LVLIGKMKKIVKSVIKSVVFPVTGVPFRMGGGSLSSYWTSLISAVIANTDRDAIVMTFPSAKAIESDLSVTVNGAARNITSATWAGAVLTLVLASEVVPGDVVVVTFATTGQTANVTNNVDIWYGVTIDEANASPDLTRIASTAGDMALHASLPVHVLMKGCLLNDNGTVNYYLKTDDWTKKADGNASKLDGTDGQVMIEIPKFYHKIDNPSSGVYQHKISLYPCTGFTEIPKFYIGAYKSTVNRTAPIKQWSIVNANAEYRGGNNNAALDGADNTQLGKPATLLSLINFRTYARARNADTKWNVIPYRQSMLLFDLFIIEYATLNSQKAFNATLTAEGYKQGGLGAGVTTVTSATWNKFNAYYPLIPCGTSNSLANGTGEVNYTIPNFGDASGAVKVNRYRGVENPFGDIWEWCDGASIFNEGAGGVSKFYTCDNPANFADGTATNYDHRANLPIANTYPISMWHDDKGILIPKDSGGDAATYWCDYYYTSGLVNAWRALLRGGGANALSAAGFVSLTATNAATSRGANLGARLCYLP